MATWLNKVAAGGKISIRPTEWLALEYIAFNLRQADKDEIFNNLHDANALELTAIVMQAVSRKGVSWVASLDGRPAAVLAVFEQWRGNWQIASFGTDNYHRAAVALKPKYYEAVDYARTNGGRRLECRSRFVHSSAQRLLGALGFTAEGTLRRYGADGSDYVQFARLLGD